LAREPERHEIAALALDQGSELDRGMVFESRADDLHRRLTLFDSLSPRGVQG